jgi:hypothetical protein
MNRSEIFVWLAEDDPQRLETLWELAPSARDTVHVRGLIEFSNYCRSNCQPTMLKYRCFDEIYPVKAGITESPHARRDRVASLLFGPGRRAGEGPGTSPNFEARRPPAASL